jgi:hypothetical protein
LSSWSRENSVLAGSVSTAAGEVSAAGALDENITPVSSVTTAGAQYFCANRFLFDETVRM